MRNMSFFHTIEQVRNGTKTVTRRLGWDFLKPSDVVMACEKCQGLKKGEKVKKIRAIRIVSIQKERLIQITQEDVIKEGFSSISRIGFMDIFCMLNNCHVFALVNRIEFEYVEG